VCNILYLQYTLQAVVILYWQQYSWLVAMFTAGPLIFCFSYSSILGLGCTVLTAVQYSWLVAMLIICSIYSSILGLCCTVLTAVQYSWLFAIFIEEVVTQNTPRLFTMFTAVSLIICYIYRRGRNPEYTSVRDKKSSWCPSRNTPEACLFQLVPKLHTSVRSCLHTEIDHYTIIR
jgi:hypothetical protein